MPVSCSDLRTFAASLVVEDAPEVALRAAVSRSYYALYHSMAPIAVDLPRADGERRDISHVGHSAVRDRFLEWHAGTRRAHLKQKAKALALAFETCRKQRVVADYGLGDEITLKQAKKHCTAVQMAMTSCQQIKNEWAKTEAA